MNLVLLPFFGQSGHQGSIENFFNFAKIVSYKVFNSYFQVQKKYKIKFLIRFKNIKNIIKVLVIYNFGLRFKSKVRAIMGYSALHCKLTVS